MHRILDTDALALANSSTQVSDEIENMENEEKWRKLALCTDDLQKSETDLQIKDRVFIEEK